MIHAVEFHWDDKAMVMVPQPRFRALCKKQYVAGEYYVLGVNEERSSASHRHYFACIKNAWDNLPEDKVVRYPTDEHLRKWALIKAGYCQERSIVCESKAQTQVVAALAEGLDEFAVVLIRGMVIKVYTAESQRMDSMSRERFERSKADVLAILSEVIGTSKEELEKQDT